MALLYVLSASEPPVVVIEGDHRNYRIHAGKGGTLPPCTVTDFLAAADSEEVDDLTRLYKGAKIEPKREVTDGDLLVSSVGGDIDLFGVIPRSLWDWFGLFFKQPTTLSSDVVSVGEIGRRLGGAQHMTTYKWTVRKDFPKPISDPNDGTRKWSWREVERWALNHRPVRDEEGRLLSGLPALAPWAYSLTDSDS